MTSSPPASLPTGGWSAGRDTGSASGVAAGPAEARTDHRRGELRIYLGAAPGPGKTFAMLGEGRRRRERGADVVVGFVETHGRELTALRELALLWVSDQVDAALDEYRERHDIRQPWEVRERVIVAITGAPDSEHLIRRAARIAQRAHGELFGVHIRSDTGLATLPSTSIADHRKLLEEVGGEYREVTGGDVAAALLDVARAENATQIVLGASRRSLWQRMTQGSVINRVIRLSGPIDVHVISDDGAAEKPTGPRLPIPRFVVSPLPPRRQAIGWAVAAIGLPLLTLALANLRSELGLPSVLLIYLVFVMAVGAAGGVFPALAAAVAGSLLTNYFFTPPYYRFTIQEFENALALVLYLGAAGIVSVLVDRVGRSRLETGRARAEAEAMAELAGSLADEDALPALVRHLRSTFGMHAVALLRRDGERWHVETEAGVGAPGSPDGADVVKEIGNNLVLVMAGPPLVGADHRVLNALGAQLATAVEAKRLHGEAARAMTLAQADDLRSALLQAVSHDLRTPLAAIKASRIIDQGPGIPRRDREVVFQPFQRLVDHGSGTGLGLAIARGFVDAMGGELSLEDTPGGGATMVLGLPRAR